jgi:hypothetical protein
VKVEISSNELVDRLRVLQSKLTDENEHSDALFVGFAIQFITSGDLKSQPLSFLEKFAVGQRAIDGAPGGITTAGQ